MVQLWRFLTNNGNCFLIAFLNFSSTTWKIVCNSLFNNWVTHSCCWCCLLLLKMCDCLLQLVTWTTWSQQPWVEWLAAFVSRVNWTLISGNWLWISSHFLVCTSSWSVLLLSHPVALSNTVHWLFQNSPSRCGIPKTWCVLLILGTVATSLRLPCSGVRWAPKRWMSKW